MKILLAIVAITTLAVILAGIRFNSYLDSPVGVQAEGADFEIPAGMAFRQVSDQLGARGILDHPLLFRLYGRLSGKAASVRAGEYRIESGTTPRKLLEKFVSGDVRLYSFTIVEGWTFRELLSAMAAHPVVETTLHYEDWPALLEWLDAEASHPEGLFLPETYHFPKGTTDRDLLRQAYALMREVLDKAWQDRAADLPIDSPYEALILASIVEKETALESERPRIAGVFTRRLKTGMRLQTDPTVIYGIGVEFDGNLTRRDLRTDTLYNTYTRSGLPPTPIALPGKAAIEAAVNPAPGTSMYFVATGLGDGSHTFSDTKDEHDEAVREYLVRQRAQRSP